MSDVYFKASLQNTLNPEVGTFDNVNNKEGTFTLEDGEYYLTNNTSNSYRVYYPTEDIYSVGFTIEFDINYNSNSGFKWLLLFNGDDSTYWHGFSLESSILRYVGNGISNYDLITSTNTWLHVKCIFDYYLNQNAVHIYIDNVEVNTFTISKDYGIKYIDILGNSGGYVADAKIKNIIIYNSSKKHYLDTIGLTSLWSKIKSLFATKTELGSKANDSDVVHKSGDETVNGTKTFSSNIVGNLTGNADTATNCPNYLPLSGGKMTGGIIFPCGVVTYSNNSSYKELCLFSDDGSNSVGAFLALRNIISPNESGSFVLCSRKSDSSFGSALSGYPDGTLVWDGKNLDVIEEQGNGYIRYSNGLQICFKGYLSNANANTAITLPKPFINTTYVSTLMSYDGAGSCSIAPNSTDKAGFSISNISTKSLFVNVISIGYWK